MLRFAILLVFLLQSASTLRPTIVAELSEPPQRNFYIIYYDDKFLFAARHYGNANQAGGNTVPGLFVHSKEHASWIRIIKISTAGGSFGSSNSDDPEAQKRLRFASVGWDFTRYAAEPYIPQPMMTPGSIVFPEKIAYESASDRYQLRYLTSWGVQSAETVLYINRTDLAAAFAKDSRPGANRN